MTHKLHNNDCASLLRLCGGILLRNKKLINNTISSLLFEIVTIICGFVLPQLILSHYGSSINGLVTSITQFLQIIAFFEMGVGAVVQSTLYKPLSEGDNYRISAIVSSANSFFRKLALILLVYVLVLCIVYPIFIAEKTISDFATVILILAISVSFFSQYYFGVVDRLLLTADQCGYVQYNAQTLTLILNTIACAFLINLGSSIQAVKLTASLIYLIRPLYLRVYVNRHYNIDRRIEYDKDPIAQKKSGIAQHIASVVLNNTDTMVLSVFSTLTNVSIYSIYNMVIYGVKQLLTSMTAGVQALLGELWARQELDELNKTFGVVEWSMHTVTTIVFGCTGVLIVPFVKVYTNNIADADYIQPLFAALITIAHAGHCLRLPYNIMILAGGHYKQTQSNYVIAAIANLTISILGVKNWGLIGVAVGTIIAMIYQTIWMAIYDSTHFLNRPLKIFAKQIFVDVLIAAFALTISRLLELKTVTYYGWILLAIPVLIIWVLSSILFNWLFYKDLLIFITFSFRKKLQKS